MINTTIDSVDFAKKILGIELHNAQKQILQCKDKYIAIRASRRMGKSYALAIYAIVEACKNSNYRIMIFSRSFRQSVEMMHTIYKIVSQSPIVDYLESDSTTMLEFKNGSIIKCTSSMNTSNYFNLVIIDEAAFVDDSVFPLIYESTLGVNGHIILASTPRPIINEFYRAFKPDSMYTKLHFTHVDTIFENGTYFVEPEETDRCYNKNTGRYRQEILAEFTDLCDSVIQVD